METNVPVPPPEAKVGLPQDFQDALSIIFDKNSEQGADAAPNGDSAAKPAEAAEPNVVISYNDESNTNMTSSSMELDEQSQYMLYGSMTDKPLVFNDVVSKPIVDGMVDMSAMILPADIPTPPVRILGANGKLMEIPNPSDALNTVDEAKPSKIDQMTAEARQKRQQELDDLAMLGIDAEDLAAQCI